MGTKFRLIGIFTNTSRRVIWPRLMLIFFDTYCGNLILAPLVRELLWTHNLIILSQSKRAEEREFYVRMAIQEREGKQYRDAANCE